MRHLSGAVAQMGERCNRTAEVRGSIPLGSTNVIASIEVKRSRTATFQHVPLPPGARDRTPRGQLDVASSFFSQTRPDLGHRIDYRCQWTLLSRNNSRVTLCVLGIRSQPHLLSEPSRVYPTCCHPSATSRSGSSAPAQVVLVSALSGAALANAGPLRLRILGCSLAIAMTGSATTNFTSPPGKRIAVAGTTSANRHH